jgi:O-antigen biosynthesis protein
VDNRPGSDGTQDLVERIGGDYPQLRYVAEPRPGSSVARNRGIAEATAHVLAFTDDDVVVDADWLERLVEPFDDPAVRAVTGMVMPFELETPAQKLFERYAGFSKGVKRRVYDMAANRAVDRVLYPFWGGVFGSGNSMAFLRSQLVETGGFDPALGAGSRALAGADIDAMSAAVLAGKLIYEPRSVCWHQHRRNEEALRRQLFNYGAGLTAIFTKRLFRDLRFTQAAIRSIPLVVERQRRPSAAGIAEARLPEDYARLERRGMARGPVLYGKSIRWARRLGLDKVLQDGHAGDDQRVGSARGN